MDVVLELTTERSSTGKMTVEVLEEVEEEVARAGGRVVGKALVENRSAREVGAGGGTTLILVLELELEEKMGFCLEVMRERRGAGSEARAGKSFGEGGGRG